LKNIVLINQPSQEIIDTLYHWRNRLQIKRNSTDLSTIYSDLLIDHETEALPTGIIKDLEVENHWVYLALPANFELQRDSFIFTGLKSIPRNLLSTYSQYIKSELDGNLFDFQNIGKFMFLLSKSNLDFCYNSIHDLKRNPYCINEHSSISHKVFFNNISMLTHAFFLNNEINEPFNNLIFLKVGFHSDQKNKITVFSDDEDFPGIDCNHISNKEFEDSEKFIIFGAHSKEQVEAYLKKNINDIKKVILVVDDTFYVLDKTNRFMNFFNASRKVWNEIS
jgi:hypothetical protein